MMVRACVEIWPTVMGLLDDRENAQHIYNEIRKNLKKTPGHTRTARRTTTSKTMKDGLRTKCLMIQRAAQCLAVKPPQMKVLEGTGSSSVAHN